MLYIGVTMVYTEGMTTNTTKARWTEERIHSDDCKKCEFMADEAVEIAKRKGVKSWWLRDGEHAVQVFRVRES